MEMLVTRADLLRELEVADRVIARKTTIPVLANIHVATGLGSVTVSATDLDLSVRAECAAEVTAQGVRTLPARRLFDLVKTLPDGASVRITSPKEDKAEVASGTMRVMLQTLPAVDFPTLPTVPDVAPVLFNQGALRDAVRRVRFAVPRDESDKRYSLSGMLLEVRDKNTVRLVATDGHRLALADLSTSFVFDGPPVREMIPRAAVDALSALLGAEGDAAVRVGDSHVCIDCGGRTLIARRSSGQYPAYERIVPKGSDVKLSVDRAQLLDAARRAQLIGDSAKTLLSLSAGSVEVSASGADVGTLSDKLAAEYGGPSLVTALNASYLTDFLDAVSAQLVTLEAETPEKPMLWRPVGDASCLYVLMPIRV